MVDDGRTDDGRRTTDGRTDGRTPDHGHPISSPCEPDGSGELKIHVVKLKGKLSIFVVNLFLIEENFSLSYYHHKPVPKKSKMILLHCSAWTPSPTKSALVLTMNPGRFARGLFRRVVSP